MKTDPCARFDDEAEVAQWLEVGVPDDVRAHAAACEACGPRLAELDALQVDLSDLGAHLAERAAGLDVSGDVLAAIDATPAAPRRRVGWWGGAAGLAMAAAVMFAVYAPPAEVEAEVHASGGATWLKPNGAPVRIDGAAQVDLPGRLLADAAPATLRVADLQATLSPEARLSFDGPAAASALIGAVIFEATAPFSMRTPLARLEGAGHIEVAARGRRAEMIKPKAWTGAAALVVAVYAGWATLSTDEGEAVRGDAPVGLAVDDEGRVSKFALAASGPKATHEGEGVGQVASALAAGEAKAADAAGAEAPSGAYWSEEEQAVRFALEGEVIDAVNGAPVEAFSLRAEAESLSGYGPRRVEEAFSGSEDGKFRLDGLSSGRWRITARAEGYAPLTQAVDLSDVSSNPYLVLPMSSGARLSGQVVDWKQAPVADARVGLAGCFGRSSKGKKGCRVETTGSDGRFVLEGLPADEAFSVRAEHDRLGSTVQPNLRRAEGETEHVVLELSGTLKVFGRVVTGKDEAPVAGAQVLAADGEVRTRTGADGAYQLFMPLENRPVVRVEVDNGRGQIVEFGSYPERRSSEVIRWVEAETHVAEVKKDFTLAADAARVFGQITDRAGAPVAGVRLRLWNTTGWHKGPRGHQTFPERTVTDEEGHYAIEGVPVMAGYTVAYEKDEGDRERLGYVNVEREGEVEANFQIGDGRIRGRFVHADTGEPFVLAGRDCQGSFAARPLAEGKSYFVAPKCLDEGRFEFEALPPGRYRLASKLPFEDAVVRFEAQQVEVTPGQILSEVQIRVTGDEAETWRFRVLDSQGRFASGLYLRHLKGNRSYTSNLEVGADGTAKASISRAFEQAFIDAQGFESAKVDLRGRDPKAVIEVRLTRLPAAER